MSSADAENGAANETLGDENPVDETSVDETPVDPASNGTGEEGDPSQPLTVTDEALATVLDVRAGEDDPANTALRVAITGSNMTDFTYALDLVSVAEKAEDDIVYTQGTHGELTMIVPEASVANMTGAVLDVASVGNGGLVIRNPNPPDPTAGLDLELEGELPQRVQAVLDQAINPALASHGGYAALVGIEETVVYVTMGGGCQGCAASAMTLRDGIKKMLLAALPELTDVVDATDHAAGENPFYTEAPV
jgi:Fe/S biogenesis protein NfuA